MVAIAKGLCSRLPNELLSSTPKQRTRGRLERNEAQGYQYIDRAVVLSVRAGKMDGTEFILSLCLLTMKCRRGWSAVHIFLNIIPVVMGCIIIANSVQQLSYSIHMTPIWASVVLLVSGILLIVLGIFGYCIQRRGFNPWMVSSFLLLFLVLIALFSISAGTYTYWYTIYAGLQKELLSNDGIPLASRGLYYSIWAGYVGLWYQGGCSGAMLCEDATAEGCEELLGGSSMGRRRQLLAASDGFGVEGWPPSIRRRTSIEQSMDSKDPPGGSGMDDDNMGPTTGVDGMERTMAPGGDDDGDGEQGM
ncbi:hypothetical protein FOZ62_002996, partial [Perkinsus olseni]